MSLCVYCTYVHGAHRTSDSMVMNASGHGQAAVSLLHSLYMYVCHIGGFEGRYLPCQKAAVVVEILSLLSQN